MLSDVGTAFAYLLWREDVKFISDTVSAILIFIFNDTETVFKRAWIKIFNPVLKLFPTSVMIFT